MVQCINGEGEIFRKNKKGEQGVCRKSGFLKILKSWSRVLRYPRSGIYRNSGFLNLQKKIKRGAGCLCSICKHIDK